MTTRQETAEVEAFLKKHSGEWVSNQECETECPLLMHRKTDESDCLPYHINEVAQEAALWHRIEEHGHDKWLVIS
jgi:hypothetical protein